MRKDIILAGCLAGLLNLSVKVNNYKLPSRTEIPSSFEGSLERKTKISEPLPVLEMEEDSSFYVNRMELVRTGLEIMEEFREEIKERGYGGLCGERYPKKRRYLSQIRSGEMRETGCIHGVIQTLERYSLIKGGRVSSVWEKIIYETKKKSRKHPSNIAMRGKGPLAITLAKELVGRGWEAFCYDQRAYSPIHETARDGYVVYGKTDASKLDVLGSFRPLEKEVSRYFVPGSIIAGDGGTHCGIITERDKVLEFMWKGSPKDSLTVREADLKKWIKKWNRKGFVVVPPEPKIEGVRYPALACALPDGMLVGGFEKRLFPYNKY
jgi:hypothetical protein